MMKYRVVGAEADADGFVEIPGNVQILNGFYHPVTGTLTIVCLEPIYEQANTQQEPEPESKEVKNDTSEASETTKQEPPSPSSPVPDRGEAGGPAEG